MLLARTALVLSILLGACSSGSDGFIDQAETYDDTVQQAFMATCAGQTADDDLTAVCECSYVSFVSEIPYERFAEVDGRLLDEEAELPEDMTLLVRACVLEVSRARD